MSLNTYAVAHPGTNMFLIPVFLEDGGAGIEYFTALNPWSYLLNARLLGLDHDLNYLRCLLAGLTEEERSLTFSVVSLDGNLTAVNNYIALAELSRR